MQGDVSVSVLQHVYCDSCLLDVDPSKEKILNFYNIQFQVFERGRRQVAESQKASAEASDFVRQHITNGEFYAKRIILHSY